jgi:hypothetical protein
MTTDADKRGCIRYLQFRVRHASVIQVEDLAEKSTTYPFLYMLAASISSYDRRERYASQCWLASVSPFASACGKDLF